MLIQLEIENVAVIERASIEFNKGLNVITGETGAGKSLLINSLNMVLGARTARDLIREGADFAKVSAVFFCKELDAFLEESSIAPDDGNIIITRKIYSDGRNLCHVNGCAVNVSLLRCVGERLVVIHGQHDSSELMDTSSHIHFLDAFCENGDLLNEYKSVYRQLKETQAALNKLSDDKTARQNEIDYLTYQIAEIEKANLSADEEETLTARKTILENAEALSSYAGNAYAMLTADHAAKELLYNAKRALESLGNIDSDTASYAEKISELYYEVEELAHDISSYMSGIEYNAGELREIDDRLDVINTLKRKYNGEISDILRFYDEASERLMVLKSFDENKEELTKKYAALLENAQVLARKLSDTRRKSAVQLSERLCEELSGLDMPKCKIEFRFTECDLCENGAEHAEFVISTNPSESPKSLAKIASGGEISRVMLAIKSVFSDFDKIPTLLFDEIDTGIGGATAQAVGERLSKLSNSVQVLVVTHSPQVAAFSKEHFKVSKHTENEVTTTSVCMLNEEQKREEIARMLSGDVITDEARAAAKILICG